MGMSQPCSTHGDVGEAHSYTCWLCLQTQGAAAALRGFTLNTEIRDGVSKTRKKPLELEKDYL